MNLRFFALFYCLIVLLSGCSQMPSTGPSASQIQSSGESAANRFQIIDVNENVTRQLIANNPVKPFSEVLTQKPYSYGVGPGDVLEFAIWEVPPATLFTSTGFDTRIGSGSRAAAFPAQMVSNNGTIDVPFAGQIKVAGLDTAQIQNKIVQCLKDKANQPQVLVRVVKNVTSNVTVVGDGTGSMRMPLTPQGERVLDALATAGGVRQPVNKVTIQITRGNKVYAMPLETIIRDPKQNVALQPGDVVTTLFQPLSFVVLGATARSQEVNFEAQGITLAQALGRAGGLHDILADAKGIFIFRFEPVSTLNWPKRPVLTTPDGKVPVIYRVDLKDPGSFFVAESFPIRNKDILYVSTAPVVQLQKFLSVLVSTTSPIFYLVSTVQAANR